MIFRILLIATVLMACHNASGQITSDGGLFTIPDGTVCAPYTGIKNVTVNGAFGCGTTASCQADFDYNGPGTYTGEAALAANGDLLFNYQAPGDYTIFIKFGAGGPEDSVRIKVLPGDPPEFNTYVCGGANASKVQLEITDPDYNSYVIDYDNDNTFETSANGGLVPAHDYGAPGPQTIKVKPDFVNCPAATQTVTVGSFDATGHQVTRLEVISESEIILDFAETTNNNMLYSVERSVNGGSFNKIANTFNVATYTDAAINPDNNFYCYRIGVNDVCSNQTIYSPQVCSAVIVLDVQDGQNLVTWRTDASSATLDVYKNSSLLLSTSNGNTSYSDTRVACGTDYCYNITSDYGLVNGIEVRSYSRTVCGTARSTAAPGPVSEIISIVEENSVELEWIPSPDYTIAEYSLYRIPTNRHLPLVKLDDPVYSDTEFSPEKGFCYQVLFTDVCKNKSERSQIVCPINLTAKLNENNTVQLIWSDYKGHSFNITNYVIERTDESGTVTEIPVQDTTYLDSNFTPGQIFTYRVRSESQPFDPSLSNRQTIILHPRIYHPTAFVPESAEPKNQTFSVRSGNAEFVTAYELRIFNRWGEMVYYSNDMNNGWDGKFKGIVMPEGTYIFKCRIEDTAGREFEYTGSVVMLRK